MWWYGGKKRSESVDFDQNDKAGVHGRGGLSWGEQGTLAGGDGGLRASLICDNMLTSALGCSTHPTA